MTDYTVKTDFAIFGITDKGESWFAYPIMAYHAQHACFVGAKDAPVNIVDVYAEALAGIVFIVSELDETDMPASIDDAEMERYVKTYANEVAMPVLRLSL